MGIRFYNYQDIPAALRAKAASEASKQVQAVLMDPLATEEQREAARARQDLLREWSQGTIPVQPNPQPADSTPESTPQDHQVEVSETVIADDGS